MGAPLKIDGLGFAGLSSTDGTARVENREKFLSFYASEAITKGDLVAFDFSASEPTNGYGNHVKICETDTDSGLGAHGIGVAAEAISSGAVGIIQVAGVCDFAKVDISETTDGRLLCGGAESGLMDALTTDAAFGAGGDAFATAILISDAADDTAASVVFLLNPANL